MVHSHPYTEDQLVEQPAIGLFAALGWQTLSAMEETFGPSPPAPLPGGEGSVYLGRETKGEVVRVGRLRAAVCQLNPSLPLSQRERGVTVSIIEAGCIIQGWWNGRVNYADTRPRQRISSGNCCVTGVLEGLSFVASTSLAITLSISIVPNIRL